MSMVVFVPGNIVGKTLDLPIHFPFQKPWGLFFGIEAILGAIEPRSRFAEWFPFFLFETPVASFQTCALSNEAI